MPWSAVRLLRLLRGSDLGELSPAWRGWHLQGDRLVSSAGTTFAVHELGWLSLTCLQARAWQRAVTRTRLSAGSSLHAAITVSDADASPVNASEGHHGHDTPTSTGLVIPSLLTAVHEGAKGLVDTSGPRQRAAVTTGLVSYKTSGTRTGKRATARGLGIGHAASAGPERGQPAQNINNGSRQA